MVQNLGLYQWHCNQLDAFHMCCLCSFCNRKLGDCIRNNDVQTKCNMTGIEAIFTKIRLRWAGHLSRMSDSILSKQHLFVQFLTSRSVGKPLLHYKDKLKGNLKWCSIPFSFWGNKVSEQRSRVPVMLFIYTKIWVRQIWTSESMNQI